MPCIDRRITRCAGFCQGIYDPPRIEIKLVKRPLPGNRLPSVMPQNRTGGRVSGQMLVRQHSSARLRLKHSTGRLLDCQIESRKTAGFAVDYETICNASDGATAH